VVAAPQDLSEHCSEFLVHAVDVEGKQSGVEAELVRGLDGIG
jgi:phosphoribosylformimino-5-aminoimidazole carboxamide ribotide isomerase